MMAFITVTVADENGNAAVLQVREGDMMDGRHGRRHTNPLDLLPFPHLDDNGMKVGADATVGTLKALVAAEMRVPEAQQVGR